MLHILESPRSLTKEILLVQHNMATTWRLYDSLIGLHADCQGARCDLNIHRQAESPPAADPLDF